MPKKVVVAIYDAVGGPAAVVKSAGDPFPAGPTNAGQYVFAYCGRHSSRRYADWSKIRWGTPLKEEGGKIWVKREGKRTSSRTTSRNGAWRPLSSLSSVTRDDILTRHEELYGTRIIPKTWVFNDFGHATCYVFKDRNKNRRLDSGKERIHGEFIHTTPHDEAATAQGKPVLLTESHGCVHVKPKDIDTMRSKGHTRHGNRFIVHKYSETPSLEPIGAGGPPYDVHFYPGLKKLVIRGRRKSP